MSEFLVNKATVSLNSEFHHAPSRVDQINCNHKQQGQASMEDETLEMNVLVINSDITHTQYVALHHAANNDIGTEEFTTM
jgi:hypothetical protein